MQIAPASAALTKEQITQCAKQFLKAWRGRWLWPFWFNVTDGMYLCIVYVINQLQWLRNIQKLKLKFTDTKLYMISCAYGFLNTFTDCDFYMLKYCIRFWVILTAQCFYVTVMLLSDWWTRSLKSHAIRLEWNKHCKHHKLCKTSFLWSVLSITHKHTHTHTHTHIEAVIAQPGAPLSLLSAGILPIQWKQHHVLFHRLPGLTINKKSSCHCLIVFLNWFCFWAHIWWYLCLQSMNCIDPDILYI